jgi:hypothetical protein
MRLFPMITIGCPHCLQTQKAPPEIIGTPVKCDCGHEFIAAPLAPVTRSKSPWTAQQVTAVAMCVVAVCVVASYVSSVAGRINDVRATAQAEERQRKTQELLSLWEESQKLTQLEERIEEEIKPALLVDREEWRERLQRRYGVDPVAAWNLHERVRKMCDELHVRIARNGDVQSTDK